MHFARWSYTGAHSYKEQTRKPFSLYSATSPRSKGYAFEAGASSFMISRHDVHFVLFQVFTILTPCCLIHEWILDQPWNHVWGLPTEAKSHKAGKTTWNLTNAMPTSCCVIFWCKSTFRGGVAWGGERMVKMEMGNVLGMFIVVQRRKLRKNVGFERNIMSIFLPNKI